MNEKQDDLMRKMRASAAGSASWACTCAATTCEVHAPTCRRELHRYQAGKGGRTTLARHGVAHFRRLRWRQVVETAKAEKARKEKERKNDVE
ncbi:MAG: hypothetical protein JW395_1921 [Nitrospira sp.]|nr:hypothetical protein [Nitrospira sp.]